MLMHWPAEHKIIDYLLYTKDYTRNTGDKEEKQE